MAATTTPVMTFAEFERLPDPPSGAHYELHHGELVTVAPPKLRHSRIQRRLQTLIMQAVDASRAENVTLEFPFLIGGEDDYRVADVALVSREHWNADADYFIGAPDLVVEVLSPSNTASEMLDRARLCLRHGAKQFWAVDEKYRTVQVTTSDGHVRIYESGGQIPLDALEGTSISVDAIFG